MPIERHFLGWNAPITTKVREFLLPEQLFGPVDLGKDLIIVPTRQAGRRLRESLAFHCAERKTALLSPRVVTPAYFLRPGEEMTNVANATEVSAVWANALMNADLAQLKGIFPVRTPDQDFPWALHMGEIIQRLRDTLADGGYRIADIPRDFSEILEELDRWQDLAKLEMAYLDQLGEFSLQDPCDLGIRKAEQPELPRGTKRIVIAAVPDPTSPMIRALEKLAEQTPITILIHAPESLADDFDDWGRPITSKWQKSLIDIPDPGINISLASSPASMSHKVLEVIASEQDHFGPADIAIGVPDDSFIPFLASDLDDRGIPPFDPSGKAIKSHPLYLLIDSYRALIGEGSYAAFSVFLRNADILDFLQKEYSLSTLKILEELDRFQNNHLPMGWEDVASRIIQSNETRQFEHLYKAVQFVQAQVAAFHDNDFDTAVRSLFQTVYQLRTVNPQNPDDEEFIAVAKAIDTALREFETESIHALGLEKKHALDLLLRRLGTQKYYLERENAVIDLEGWLEIPWNDAQLLIVTGMNDGSVPDSQLSDMFLPDSLRVQLNLRHDTDRLARDAYLMRTLVESRRETGRTCFVTSKTSSTGDPLKPSRLLFRCTDSELPERAKALFGDPSETRTNHPATVSFPLQATPPADIRPERLELQKLSVTAFKDYLACPFRFYLKHILDMEELDDQKTEMDSLDFGSLVHEVLQKMAENEQVHKSENERELSKFLHSQAESWVMERFGKTPPLPVQIQLDSAKQRLWAAARVQVQLTSEGWEILHHEMRISTEMNGVIVSGRIDRIDRHRETGQIRILDYKTSDRVTLPEAAHLGSASPDVLDYARISINGKEKRWIDLQLPLYRILLADEMDFKGQLELGYFNLPKAINDTGIIIWENFREEQLESARNCTESVIEDILNRKFWPPTAKVQYDDFESLFPADITDCIDTESFEAFMKRYS